MWPNPTTQGNEKIYPIKPIGWTTEVRYLLVGLVSHLILYNTIQYPTLRTCNVRKASRLAAIVLHPACRHPPFILPMRWTLTAAQSRPADAIHSIAEVPRVFLLSAMDLQLPNTLSLRVFLRRNRKRVYGTLQEHTCRPQASDLEPYPVLSWLHVLRVAFV